MIRLSSKELKGAVERFEGLPAQHGSFLFAAALATVLFRFGDENRVSYAHWEGRHAKEALLVNVDVTIESKLAGLVRQIAEAADRVSIDSILPVTPTFIVQEASDAAEGEADNTVFPSNLVVFIGTSSGKIVKATISYRAEVYTDFFVSNVLESFASAVSSLIGIFSLPTAMHNVDDVLSRADAVDGLLCDVATVSPAQAGKLQIWNQTVVSFPKNECLHELFEAQVQSNGDNCAVYDPDDASYNLSYQDLDRQANKLANLICATKDALPANTFIGVYLPRSGQVYKAFLAIMKAGCAYLALDPAYPAERVEYILKDSRAPILLTTLELAKNVTADSSQTVICLDDDNVTTQLRQMVMSRLFLSSIFRAWPFFV
jgi:hypothetical protein